MTGTDLIRRRSRKKILWGQEGRKQPAKVTHLLPFLVLPILSVSGLVPGAEKEGQVSRDLQRVPEQ